MKRNANLFGLLLLLLAVSATAQNPTLVPVTTVVPPLTLGPDEALLVSQQCDSRGNIYVNSFDSSDPAHPRPIWMFDRDGSLQRKFLNPHSSRRPDAGFAYAFAPLPQGGVVIANQIFPDVYITRFSPSGQIESDVKLDVANFIPYHVAVFPTGELLLSGIQIGDHTPDNRYSHRGFAAIYDPNGHLRKKVVLDGDEKVDQAIELGDSQYARDPGEGNRSVIRGAAVTGEDGNVYLMRATSPATVYVISSSGNVVREITVRPRTFGDVPLRMQLSKQKLAVVFGEWLGDHASATTMSVVDATTGDTLADYSLHGLWDLACYQSHPETFTFVTNPLSSMRHIQFVTARKK